MTSDHALTLLRIALELAPWIARVVRAGVDASPGDADAERVASILPVTSESQRVADTLRSPPP